MGYDAALVAEIRSALASARNPERAVGQRAYMKSALPFHGLTTPELRRILTPLLRQHAPSGHSAWEATVRELWDGATHREQRYAALQLAQDRSARAWQDPSVLELYRHLVVTGAWWDVVDLVATRLVGPVLLAHREAVTPVMDRWAVEENLWLRRTAILAQLKHRADTDTALLERTVAANLDGSRFGGEFFVQKAIGWALREQAKTDSAWVVALLDRYADRVSPLSRREATRHLR